MRVHRRVGKHAVQAHRKQGDTPLQAEGQDGLFRQGGAGRMAPAELRARHRRRDPAGRRIRNR